MMISLISLLLLFLPKTTSFFSSPPTPPPIISGVIYLDHLSPSSPPPTSPSAAISSYLITVASPTSSSPTSPILAARIPNPSSTIRFPQPFTMSEQNRVQFSSSAKTTVPPSTILQTQALDLLVSLRVCPNTDLSTSEEVQNCFANSPQSSQSLAKVVTKLEGVDLEGATFRAPVALRI
ncbi:hypothetical protein ScalyP_jg3981 [Parmales sp. scaly parma]|nr:hypothetical protein ScalyP_jg3981 [Parmales sp. scaly parma]